MKRRRIQTAKEADQLVEAVTQSAVRAMEQITKLPAREALRALWSMKVERIGCDPLDSDTPLNLIEQLNQTFTYVASARAAKELLLRHPKLAPLTLNLGTASGTDVESVECGGLAAEVFAAVSTRSNRKLEKDIYKVGLTAAKYKYVFFMCPGYAAGRQQKLETRPDVEVWSVGALL